MSADLLIVLALLAACVVAFATNRVRMDVVALLVLMALPLTGVLTVPEALAGFSDPNVLLIALLFVIGDGLVRTGLAYQIGDRLTERAGRSERRLLVLLMLSVAGMGSMMSSTGVVAIFIPVVLGIARRANVSPSRLMMPLSFAGLISGMLTLVATPPNMVVDSALRQAGHEGFGFFAITPLGVAVLVLGIGYLAVARRWLRDGGGAAAEGPKHRRRTLVDFIRTYQLEGRALRLRVREDSPLVGKTLAEWKPRDAHGANIVAIERQARFRTEVIHPRADTRLHAGDVLLVDRFRPNAGAEPHRDSSLGLEELALRGAYFTDQLQDIGMAEVMVAPDSSLLDKSVIEVGFRRNHRLNVIGLHRGKRAIVEGMLEEKLRVGDTLLVIGPWKAIARMQAQVRDFVVLDLPAEVELVAPARKRAPYALGALLVMVVLMVTGAVPNVYAALIACLLLGAFRCLDPQGSYRAIHWQSLVLIVGMMPFAVALQKTGGVQLAAEGLLHIFGNATPRLLLAALFAATALVGLFISNTATAVLMAPVALKVAEDLGASPYPFAITVAMAASAAFMTPVSSPVNTLVMAPGQYTFWDFFRIGVPFTVLVLLTTVLLAPLLFPF